MGGIFVSQTGEVVVSNIQSSPSTICDIQQIISSTNNTLLVRSNLDRKGLIIYNESGYSLYMKFGDQASPSSFSILISPTATYEMQQSILYTGDIYGIWEKADGFAHITELK